jgi:hypothetical protein
VPPTTPSAAAASPARSVGSLEYCLYGMLPRVHGNPKRVPVCEALRWMYPARRRHPCAARRPGGLGCQPAPVGPFGGT